MRFDAVEVPVMKKPQHYLPHVVSYGVQRIQKERNKNFIVIINGETGSGKTYAGLDLALKFAGRIGTPFTVENNMAFTFKEFLQKSMLEENKQPGTVLLFEEVGAVGGGAAASEWQKKSNKNFNTWLQTARSLNQIIILTTPRFGYLDKKSRELVHMQISMIGINYQSKKSIGKPLLKQIPDNPGKTDKIYWKYLRVCEGPNKYKCSRVFFDLPPKDVVDAYEKRKQEYQDALYKKFLEEEEGGGLNKLEQRMKVKWDALLPIFEDCFRQMREPNKKGLAVEYDMSPITVSKYWARFLRDKKREGVTQDLGRVTLN